MEEPRKHWRSGKVEDTPFRVEIWSHDGKTMIKSLQIDDLPPELYGDDELHVADAEAAFAKAERMVAEQLQQRRQIEQDQADLGRAPDAD
ncbi:MULTISPECIES: hypothetical protein [Pseudoxanthomonas]|uniref:Uncharacterized protein n=1 Tax=Pseudoxanthomonas winnipegensis TaxID=2480810 RepID=A0AAW8GA74_9GAMM|nr:MULTISPECIES: hypothetical protein [Pseudoxanthomonas]MDQ1118098.1 hypothetical protein [Pseudoxanthomonas winnipegensis]MDQ1135068.1 hypothetical protein [Pseudoxanthomonas winnipegensis]MDR6138701.1 hypothetical protein [Pseudoxanthomonas sp. SORGH_AS_0997]